MGSFDWNAFANNLAAGLAYQQKQRQQAIEDAQNQQMFDAKMQNMDYENQLNQARIQEALAQAAQRKQQEESARSKMASILATQAKVDNLLKRNAMAGAYGNAPLYDTALNNPTSQSVADAASMSWDKTKPAEDINNQKMLEDRIYGYAENPELADEVQRLATIKKALNPKTSMEGLSDTQLYSVLAGSNDPGERTKAENMLKFRRAQEGEVYGTTNAKRQAEIQTAAPLESEKKKGEGAITDIQKKATGQSQVSGILSELQNQYNKLNKKGGIVNTEADPASNLEASASSSSIGQWIGSKLGTETQSIRNQIKTTQPLLLNAIRQASNMGARGLDSEKELEFYLKAATDPTLDIQTNLNAIKVLEKAYGLNSGSNDKGQQQRIRVKSPDGRIGTIPASQLSDAIKNGYTRVQ